MKPFRERNPVTIGAVGLVAIALFMLAAFRAEDLPLIGGGDIYYAQFSEAGGLKPNDEVRVAGVRVGQVEDITLDDGHVLVKFRIDKGTEFGDETGAAIRVKTLLGAMFLALEPAGSGQLDPDSEIPLARTASPYDVVEAFSGLASTEQRIDTDQLATVARTSWPTRSATRRTRSGPACAGCPGCSQNVAARDEQLDTLLTNASKVSKVLADRNANLKQLFKDGNVLLQAVYERRQAVHHLLVARSSCRTSSPGWSRDTRADLKPALDHLDNVVDLLERTPGRSSTTASG